MSRPEKYSIRVICHGFDPGSHPRLGVFQGATPPPALGAILPGFSKKSGRAGPEILRSGVSTYTVLNQVICHGFDPGSRISGGYPGTPPALGAILAMFSLKISFFGSYIRTHDCEHIVMTA